MRRWLTGRRTFPETFPGTGSRPFGFFTSSASRPPRAFAKAALSSLAEFVYPVGEATDYQRLSTIHLADFDDNYIVRNKQPFLERASLLSGSSKSVKTRPRVHNKKRVAVLFRGKQACFRLREAPFQVAANINPIVFFYQQRHLPMHISKFVLQNRQPCTFAISHNSLGR